MGGSTAPLADKNEFTLRPQIVYSRTILILSYHLCLSPPRGFSLNVYRTEFSLFSRINFPMKHIHIRAIFAENLVKFLRVKQETRPQISKDKDK
jgi:hypothetical protein